MTHRDLSRFVGEADEMIIRKPGRPDRDWWAPIIDDRLIVLLEDVLGAGSEGTVIEHKVVVCTDRETARRYGVWHAMVEGRYDARVSEVYWPRYLDGIEPVSPGTLDAMQEFAARDGHQGG